MDYLERLLAVQDSEYAKFHAKLIPNINASLILGIRVPEARKLARILYKDPEHYEYMGMLPHKFYDERISAKYKSRVFFFISSYKCLLI